MTVYEALCLLGIPAAAAALYGAAVRQLYRVRSDSVALKAGVQALLRTQMIHDYNKYTEMGYAPIYARENFENCWQRYHALGVNGVMNDLHDKFMALPTEPEREEGEE